MAAGMISHYRLLRRLGVGGMGEVFLAHDTELDRSVALKVMSAELARDENQRKRFRTEVRSVSGLSHPNICVVHEVGETPDGRPFLAMEYVEGEPLEAVLQQRRLKIREALKIGIQVAAALKTAHAGGIVHRDIKPGNIMLDRQGNVKVLDFGLAKRFGREELGDGASSAARTRTGMLIGTPHYMSPEQALGRVVDHRTDIFSLGVVLYEILAGQRPFLGKTVGEILNNVVNQPPAPLELENPLFSPALDRIIFHCLEKEPEKRYESAETLGADLERLNAESQQAATLSDLSPVAQSRAAVPGTAPATLTEAARSPAGRPWSVYALAGVLLVFLVIASGFYLARTRAGAQRARAGLSGVPEKSVAVLPFDNFSAEPDTDYLGDGLTEEITTALSSISGLKVAARNSAFTFKGRKEDVRKIGQALRVSTLLEGSVRKAGNRIRVTAQLINVADGFHLWSETYERSVDDLFAVQEDIARRIAERLEAANGAVAQGRKRMDPEAHSLYLQARVFWNKRTDPGLRTAATLFKQAIRKDPLYAQAHAGLSSTYFLMPLYARMEPNPATFKEYYPMARAAANRALELDPACAEAHVVLANLQAAARDHLGAEEHFRRALELAPNYATAHHWYGRYLNINGRWEEGLKQLQEAVELDPLSPVIRSTIPEYYFLTGDYDRGIELSRKVVEAFPDFVLVRSILAEALLKKGLYQEALDEIEKARALDSSDPLAGMELKAYAFARLGRETEARKLLADLETRVVAGKPPWFSLAIIHTGLREFDQSIDCLEKAFADQGMDEMILCNPFTEEFRDSPRFLDLKRRVAAANKESAETTSR